MARIKFTGLFLKTFRRTIVTFCLACCLGATALRADVPSPGGGVVLNTWAFTDTNWLSDLRYSPLKFSHLVNVPDAGDGNALLLDTSNATPAYLVYRAIESDGTTNITIPTGSISFWFNPRWSGTNAAGTGPGAAGRFFEVGNYTTNASVGWLSLYVSADGTMVYFAGQTNNGFQNTYLSAPVTFLASNWFNLALTWGPTNSAFYTNGVLVTNGTGVAYYPNAAVVSNGFSIGSSASNVISQTRAMYDDVSFFNYQLDPGTISGNFLMYSLFYGFTNYPDFTGSAPPFPAFELGEWGVATGGGYTTYSGAAAGCATNSLFWLTNFVVLTNTGVALEFTVQGGLANTPYDLFGASPMTALQITNSQWYWLGRVYSCGIYTLTNQPTAGAVYLLTTTPDSDGDGLTDGYEILVSHTSPNNPFSNADGIPEAWKVLHNLNPEIAGLSSQDPDQDGLMNLQEYLYGTDPWVSEGMAVWSGVQSGASGIP